MSESLSSFSGLLVWDVGPDTHGSDYEVMISPLEDFKKKMEEAGLQDKVVYLDRKDRYKFQVKK